MRENEGEKWQEKSQGAMVKGNKEMILKINTYSLKFPYIVPLSLKQKQNKIK